MLSIQKVVFRFALFSIKSSACFRDSSGHVALFVNCLDVINMFRFKYWYFVCSKSLHCFPRIKLADLKEFLIIIVFTFPSLLFYFPVVLCIYSLVCFCQIWKLCTLKQFTKWCHFLLLTLKFASILSYIAYSCKVSESLRVNIILRNFIVKDADDFAKGWFIVFAALRNTCIIHVSLDFIETMLYINLK